MAQPLRPFFRSIATSNGLRASMSEPLKVAHTNAEHAGGYKMWRTLFFVVCIPSILLAGINSALMDEPEPPEFKKYPHLRIRNKKYPWRDGVKTLFHNPHTNALPDGYEHA